MFIQTQTLPNSANLNILPGCEVLAKGIRDLHYDVQTARSPLAERSFPIPEAAGVPPGRRSIIIAKVAAEPAIGVVKISIRLRQGALSRLAEIATLAAILVFVSAIMVGLL